MSIFFRNAESRTAQGDQYISVQIAWERVAVAAGVLAILALIGGVEYHIGIEKVGDALFAWTERTALLLFGLLLGEAMARLNRN